MLGLNKELFNSIQILNRVVVISTEVETGCYLSPNLQNLSLLTMTESLHVNFIPPLQRRLEEFEVETLQSIYADKVNLKIRLAEEKLEGFKQMFADLTAGQGELVVIQN